MPPTTRSHIAQSEDGDVLPYGRWDDLRAPTTGINPTGPASPPTVDPDDGSLRFAQNQDNLIAVTFQMSHSWKEGTTIYPHLHWVKPTSAAGTVAWQMRWRLAAPGEVFSAWTAWADLDAEVLDDDTAEKQAIDRLTGGLSMVGKVISTMLLFNVRRQSQGGGDTYPTYAKLLEVDLHYQMDALGSVSQFTKNA